ncbi:hypothetical protein MASR1M42_00480 [Azonexus hydrophilus]
MDARRACYGVAGRAQTNENWFGEHFWTWQDLDWPGAGEEQALLDGSGQATGAMSGTGHNRLPFQASRGFESRFMPAFRRFKKSNGR